jgi:molybdenum cofactor cytidylyltransferase
VNLWTAVRIGEGSIVCVIGAGGKTTTVFALAEEGVSQGRRVLVTTTTRMWRPDLPLLLTADSQNLDRALGAGFHHHNPLAAGTAVSPDGKLLGLQPEQVCSLRSPQVILCEADGAAGRSLKIHRAGEPVVPACASHLLVLAGLDALGRSFSQMAHPTDYASSYFGLSTEAAIEPGHVADALLEGAIYRPQHATLTFILNKAEGEERVRIGRSIATRLLHRHPTAGILLLSHGRVIEVMDGGATGDSYTRP